MRALFFDFETTGLVKPLINNLDQQPKAIELSIVSWNGRMKTIEFDGMFDPGFKIDPIITKITGFTYKDLEGKPTFQDCWDNIKKVLSTGDILVGHNARFVNDILRFELERLGETSFPQLPLLCTMEATHCIFGYRLSLSRLYTILFNNDFSNDIGQAHRALNDTLALVDCYIEMKKRKWLP